MNREEEIEESLHKVKQLKACGCYSNINKLALVWTFYSQWFEYLKIWTPPALRSLAVFLWYQFKCQGSLSSIAYNSITALSSYIIPASQPWATEHWSVQHSPPREQKCVSYQWLLDQVSWWDASGTKNHLRRHKYKNLGATETKVLW